MISSEKEQFYISIGNLIKVARINIGMSQANLADRINMSRASIVNIEKGRQLPPIYLLWQLSKLLNVSIVDLLPEFTLLKDNNIDFFEEKLKYKLNKGIINESSEEKLNSFLNNEK